MDKMEAIEKLDSNLKKYLGYESKINGRGIIFVNLINEFLDDIKLKCTFDKQEEFDDIIWVCSHCNEFWYFSDGNYKDNNYKYCPNCSAEIIK